MGICEISKVGGSLEHHNLHILQIDILHLVYCLYILGPRYIPDFHTIYNTYHYAIMMHYDSLCTYIAMFKTHHCSRIHQGTKSAVPVASSTAEAKRPAWTTLRGWNMIIHLHPRKLTWNPKMEVGKMIFLFSWVIFRFHVNFQGCTLPYILCAFSIWSPWCTSSTLASL